MDASQLCRWSGFPWVMIYFLPDSCTLGVFLYSCSVCWCMCLSFLCTRCPSMHVCACQIYSQRRLISPAGPVRLFLGALSSQLEATTVTCLPNIWAHFFSLLLSPHPNFFIAHPHACHNINDLLSPTQQWHSFWATSSTKQVNWKENWSFMVGSKITPKTLQSQMTVLGIYKCLFCSGISGKVISKTALFE